MLLLHSVIGIEEIVSFEKPEHFHKVPKKSYEAENSDFNQIDFPINHMMLMSSQYKLVDKFNYKEEYKRLKMSFLAVLGKSE